MPTWFGQATTRTSSAKKQDPVSSPTPSAPKDKRPPQLPLPSRPIPVSPQPSPKLPPPISSGVGMHTGKAPGVAAPIAKPRRLPFSSIQPEVGIDAIYPDASGGTTTAARAVRSQLAPSTPESPSFSITKARGPEYVTVTREREWKWDRRALPLPSPILSPASVSAPIARHSHAQPAHKGTAHAPRIGPFRLLKSLNGGTFGASYVAQDKGTSGRIVCARVFKKDRLAAEEKIKSGLLVEVQCYKVIAASPARDRARLMEIHGVLQDEERVFFIMPLMHCDLLDALGAASGRLDRALVRRWTAQLALGIDALHRMGIIHRDIKPENVLVDAPNGNVHLADLNTAFIVQAGTPLADGEVYTKHPVGSQPYMAWEVTEGRWYGKMVDWWALGCVMYDLLTNAILFKDHGARKRYARWDRKFDGMSFLHYMGDLTDEEESVIGGLIDLHPCSRFQLRHLRHHTYFFDQNRANVFDGLLREQPDDLLTVGRDMHPSLLQVQDELRDAPLYHATPRPLKVRSHEREVGEEEDFSGFGWINKRGLWWS